MPEDVKCPICGSETVVRRGKKGLNAGKKFHVCLYYPDCKGKVAINGQEDTKTLSDYDKILKFTNYPEAVRDEIERISEVEKKDYIVDICLNISKSALSTNKSISDVWTTMTGNKLTQQIKWYIHMEMLYFFLHMICRYAQATGGYRFRADLQDEIVIRSVTNIVKRSLNTSRAKKGFDSKARFADMMGKTLAEYNNSNDDYATCKEFMSGEKGIFAEQTILGKLAKRINNLADAKLNLNLRMYIFVVATEALAQAKFKKQVEDIYRIQKKLH